MKRILSLLLAGMMVLGMASCTSGEANSTTTAGATTEATTTRRVITTPPPISEDKPSDLEDWTLLELASDWHYKIFKCPYTDAEGNPKGDAGGVFLYDTDEMAQWMNEKGEEWYKNPDVIAEMAAWDTKTAPMGDRYDRLGDGNSPIGWAGDYHGIVCYTTFELTAEQMELVGKAEANDIYMNVFYDNAFYVYINGVPVFSHDAGGEAGDWVDSMVFVDFEEGIDIRKILKEGTNEIVVTLKDCWGGREFIMSLECQY